METLDRVERERSTCWSSVPGEAPGSRYSGVVLVGCEDGWGRLTLLGVSALISEREKHEDNGGGEDELTNRTEGRGSTSLAGYSVRWTKPFTF